MKPPNNVPKPFDDYEPLREEMRLEKETKQKAQDAESVDDSPLDEPTWKPNRTTS